MESEKLMPCPFCGESEFVQLGDENTVHLLTPEDDEYSKYPMSIVICAVAEHAGERGGCGGASGYYLDPKDAVNAWNRRMSADDHK